MAGSRPQFHGNAISMENRWELSINVISFYQQQQQQEQLLQQQQQQQQQQQINSHNSININENQNCENEDLDETNSKSHLSFPLFLHMLFWR